MAETAAARKKREAAEAAALEAQHAAEGAVDEVNAEGEPEAEVEHVDNIVQLINKISQEAGALAPERSAGVPFPFRGVDGTVNHLAPKLRKYGVVVVPEVQTCVTTPNMQGNRTVKTSEVLTKFTFYAPDMTSISATTAGLADDYGDRSAAQAQSVAYRIALLQTFSLPTMDKEPEQTGMAVENGAMPKAPVQPRAATTVSNAKQAAPAAPAGPDPRVIQTQIKAAAGVRNVTGAQINAYGSEFANGDAEWLGNVDVLKKVLDAIQKLPLAESD